MANAAPKGISKPHLRDHYRNQQGKDYIEYGGLIAEFHTQNDAWMKDHPDAENQRGIVVEIVQVPTAENGNYAVCSATVFMANGMVYKEVADADDKNTNRMVAPAKLRMAATRAKGRALRDALNIGETMWEELPDAELPDEDDQPKPKSDGPVTSEQLKDIKALLKDLGRATTIPKNLTEATAATFIEQLEAELDEQKDEALAVAKQLTTLIPRYAEEKGISQDSAVETVKDAVGIKGKISAATLEQQKAALTFLQKEGVAA